MKIEYDIMLDIVLKYCNQDYSPLEVPFGLQRIVEEMCKYVENSAYSNKKSETIATYSYTLDEKDLFNTFSGMLSVYKRLKTL